MIPKIIIQYCKDDNINKDYLSYINTIKKIHPHWQYLLITQDIFEEILNNNYPEYVFMYNKLKNKKKEN